MPFQCISSAFPVHFQCNSTPVPSSSSSPPCSFSSRRPHAPTYLDDRDLLFLVGEGAVAHNDARTAAAAVGGESLASAPSSASASARARRLHVAVRAARPLRPPTPAAARGLPHRGRTRRRIPTQETAIDAARNGGSNAHNDAAARPINSTRNPATENGVERRIDHGGEGPHARDRGLKWETRPIKNGRRAAESR